MKDGGKRKEKKPKKLKYYSLKGFKQEYPDKVKNDFDTKLPSIKSNQNRINFPDRNRNSSFNLELKKEDVDHIYRRKTPKPSHLSPLKKKLSFQNEL